jgi:hypothetical protein
MVKRKRVSILGFVGIFVLFTFIPVAQAEQPIDFTDCGTGTFTLVSDSKEFMVTVFEVKGITRSNLENKVFDNVTYHHAGVTRIVAGKMTVYGYTKYLDPDGDFVILEINEVGPPMEGTWKFLYGTGKYKGITGTGKHFHTAGGKPITPGTVQSCSRNVGTFELPK